MSSGATWRTVALARLSHQSFDVLVVGGGATGAAIARDAVLRGLDVALCERGDFAGETSGQSSKLIHGGLRYLQQGNLPLVFEALGERSRLMQTAPHLCRPCEFLFPFYAGERPRRATVALGVAIYDALALWRPPTRSGTMNPDLVHSTAPWLRTTGLQGAVTYTDCQTDDARLVLESILDAQNEGAVICSRVNVGRPQQRRGYLHVVQATDRESGSSFPIRARAIVNAAGPFVDAFSDGPAALRPTLGVHICVPALRLPTGGRAFLLRAPQDGRVMFVLPAGPRTIIGTTDTDWRPDSHPLPAQPGDPVSARRVDVSYLLTAARHHFPAVDLGPDDVVATFAGLRPLLHSAASDPSATSREHDIWIDKAGVLTIAGGKLTTFRRMACDAVDQLIDLLRARGLDRPMGRSRTARRPLPGGRLVDAGTLSAHEMADDTRTHLLRTYGHRAPLVAALLGSAPSLHARLVPHLPYLRAEVLFAARHDLAYDVDDVLRRRLAVFREADDQGLGVAGDVADILALELGWTRPRRDISIADYQRVVAASRRWRTQ